MVARELIRLVSSSETNDPTTELVGATDCRVHYRPALAELEGAHSKHVPGTLELKSFAEGVTLMRAEEELESLLFPL